MSALFNNIYILPWPFTHIVCCWSTAMSKCLNHRLFNSLTFHTNEVSRVWRSFWYLSLSVCLAGRQQCSFVCETTFNSLLLLNPLRARLQGFNIYKFSNTQTSSFAHYPVWCVFQLLFCADLSSFYPFLAHGIYSTCWLDAMADNNDWKESFKSKDGYWFVGFMSMLMTMAKFWNLLVF